MKIIIFGATGQLGSSLQNYLCPHHQIISDMNNDQRIDLRSKSQVESFLQENPADLYINAAAYTNVDEAEINQKECLDVNYEFIKILVNFLKTHSKPLIHFSTDYVYGNHEDEYLKEVNKLNPINFYGKSKKLGEQEISDHLFHYFIFRISWLYSPIRKNFYVTMKNLFQQRNEISIVNDQWGSPTPVEFVSEHIKFLVNNNSLNISNAGIYNLSPKGNTTWYLFAQHILQSLNNDLSKTLLLQSINSDEYLTKAKRQKNSKMSCEKFQNTFKVELEDWIFLYKKYEY